MKKKIVEILVLALLIISTIIPLAVCKGIEKKSELMMPGVIDQEQPDTSELYWLEGGLPNWQQFYNRGKVLEAVELHVGCYFSGSYPITLTIKETIAGPDLTSVTYNAIGLPDNHQEWTEFNFPDVVLQANKIYYMILTFDIGSEYAWSGAHNDTYSAGASSHPDADWDFAFRTIVDKSKTRELYTPLQYFFEKHPYLFPILRNLLGL